MKEQLKAILEQLRGMADTAQRENRDFRPDEKSKAEALLKNAEDLRARIAADEDLRKSINDLGGELAPGGMTSRGSGRSSSKASAWGDAVLKAAVDPFGRFKAITSGSITVPSLSTTLARIEDRPMSLLELIPVENLEGTDQFSYLRETARTFNAAPVAVGAAKPVSVGTLEKVTETVKTIAHLTEPVARQTLSDAALLRAYIEDFLRQGVMLEVESQVLTGDGTGENFEGLDAVSGTQDQAWDTDILTTCRKAITLLELQNIFGGAFVFHPSDWERADLAQDNEARYLFGGPDAPPVDAVRRKLWGKPVALSSAQADGNAWLVDFEGSTRLYEREGVQIDWSENVTESGVTDFVKNQLRFRGEGRWGFALMRPAAAIEIDLTA